MIKVFSHIDSFRDIHPDQLVYSRYYRGPNGVVEASRIDRSYHWGNITVESAQYLSVAFSDHLSLMMKVALHDMGRLICPKFKSRFKTSPDFVYDKTFRNRLEEEMIGWNQVKDRGLNIMIW